MWRFPMSIYSIWESRFPAEIEEADVADASPSTRP